MPSPTSPLTLTLTQPQHPSPQTLQTALSDLQTSPTPTQAQYHALTELTAFLPHLATPLAPPPPPNSTHRTHLSTNPSLILSLPTTPPSQISLGPDLLSVALALSTELHLDELATAALLFDARVDAALHPDHDVVLAAKRLFFRRRRDHLHYLHHLLRAALLIRPEQPALHDDAFIPKLIKARDQLLNDHSLLANLLRTLSTGLKPQPARKGPASRLGHALNPGEALLLAEAIFLLAYTTQISAQDALALRALLDHVDRYYATFRPVDQSHLSSPSSNPQAMSPPQVEAESVRNLILLAWMCALDRCRTHDVYDPRTGLHGVNALLKDLAFIPRTNTVPPMGEQPHGHLVGALSSAQAAAELVGCVFRLAVAAPDEEEAKLTALRLCAHAGALHFLANDLASWISTRAGSLSADADLYADVVEDLALDIAEASQFVTVFISYTQQEVSAASAELAYANFDAGAASALGVQNRPSPVSPPPGPSSPTRRLSLGGETTPGSARRKPTTPGPLRGGRPPRPPSGRQSMRLPAANGNGPAVRAGLLLGRGGRQALEQEREGPDEIRMGITANLIAGLATFLAEAISLAPSKLGTDSIGGGLRYWSGIGAPNPGVIHQLADAVIDLFDATMGNPNSQDVPGCVYRESMAALLLLLARTAQKDGSPSHASSSLQYLRNSGQTVITLERASQAMAHFHNSFSATPSRHPVPELDEGDIAMLRGVLDVVANAAETLRPHGGITLILGDSSTELAMRMASLAVHDVSPILRESLLSAMCGLDNRRALGLFLESVARDKAAPLRHFIRTVEAQSGTYNVTMKVLDLTADCVAWGDDEFPDTAVEAIASWFATEEVLAFWSRRRYSVEAHRWRVVGAAANLIRQVVLRNPRSERSYRILARLLTPAPGTGAASSALKALVCATGLMRAGDESTKGFAEGVHGHASTYQDKQQAYLFHIAGRDSLIHAAETGLGEAYREMQKAAPIAARMISLLLSIPSGRVATAGIVVAPAAELLLGEAKGISSAASLVFAVSNFIPSIARAGYAPSVCAAILGMLSLAARESPNIAAILARDPSGTSGSALQFRASLANIVARSTTASMGMHKEPSGDAEHALESNQQEDPSIMLSALRVVEASLGDGGNTPGIFLLGLQLDSSGLYSSAEYGVLGALVELVAGAHDSNGRIDDKCRGMAATFLNLLAATTVRRTSLAVLEHLKDVAKPSDPNVRGGGFADEMLFRILEAVGSKELDTISTDVDWAALGELLSACMSLSALQVRLFPKCEIETCISTRRTDVLGLDADGLGSPAIPSPLELLKLLSLTASSGQMAVAADGLRTWCHLLGARLGVHERNTGYSSVPLLFELTSVLLGALAGADGGNDLSALVRKDGGKMAASMVLLCISRMRDCDNPHEPGSEEYIGDVQCTALLSGVIRAIAGVFGVGADVSFARTSLYAALLVCGSLAKSRISDDAVGRAFGGRLGPRQVSGAEAVISAACADAVSGPRAGARAAAMAAAAITTVLDPVRSMPALGTQNRLRRVVHAALADAQACKLISQACSKSPSSPDLNSTETGRERAAMSVAEAAIALIHAVASVGHGARVIADSGCIESAGSLLSALVLPGHLDYSQDEDDFSGIQRSTRRSLIPMITGGEDAQEGMDDDSLGYEKDRSFLQIERPKSLSPPREGEARMSMLASITGAIAAAICCADAAVFDGTLAALEDGKMVLSELLRGLRSPRIRHLEAVGSLGMIISRIPYEMLSAAASPTQLRASLAAVVGAIIPAASSLRQIGASGSPLSAGINLRRPESHREARRMKVMHPEGGSLFERDLVGARAACAQNVFASLRCPSGLLFLFVPQLVERPRTEVGAMRGGGLDGAGQSMAVGRLSEIVRISKASLDDLERSAEESMQIDTRIAGESGSSISSRRVNELAAFCKEEFGVGGEGLNGQMVIDCMKKASKAARNHADMCMSIFEATLFILREYVRTARETVRGSMHLRRGSNLFGNEEEKPGDDMNGSTLSFGDAELLISDAKNVLVPICKEVEGLAGGVWGSKDSSFCKQLCRQIRTACTGRG